MGLHEIPGLSLNQGLITDELRKRPHRVVSDAAVNRAILELLQMLANSPKDVLKHLAETALRLCNAHTVGISLLEHEEGREVFRWRALTGKLAEAIGLSMARDDSPCGQVIDQRANLLFAFPEKYFPFPAPVDPPIVEVLLSPFYDGDKPVGTIWVVAHDNRRKFDSEDIRILEELCRFTTSAYAYLRKLGHVIDLRVPSESTFKHDGLVVDLTRRKVSVDGRDVYLTPSELTLLHTLIAAPGRVHTRKELLKRLYPDGGFVVDRVVDVHVGKLRQKIESKQTNPRYILTARGAGYYLNEAEFTRRKPLTG